MSSGAPKIKHSLSEGSIKKTHWRAGRSGICANGLTVISEGESLNKRLRCIHQGREGEEAEEQRGVVPPWAREEKWEQMTKVLPCSCCNTPSDYKTADFQFGIMACLKREHCLRSARNKQKAIERDDVVQSNLSNTEELLAVFVFQTTNHSLKQMQAMVLHSILETLFRQKLKAAQSTVLPPGHPVPNVRAP